MLLARRPFLLGLSALAFLHRTAAAQVPTVAEPLQDAHAIAMHGEPLYPAGFSHFGFVNPDAPKGGRLAQASIGSWDSFNAFIAKGDPAPGITLIYDSLTTAGPEEAFTQYGLLAERIDCPADRSWVVFHLNPAARWHDGQPITADDVIWTFESLLEKGAPAFRFYYASVARAVKEGERTVRFEFHPGENRELPLILGQITVLPKHWWTAEGREIADTTLEVPLGSGPYKVGAYEPGRSIEYQRVEDWWGKDLGVSRGYYNFDRLRYLPFRDQLVARQSLKAGDLDVFTESQAKAWATEYDIQPVRDGRLLKEEFEDLSSGGMQNFTMNSRRAYFRDSRVRYALAHAFDFEWTNKYLFNGLYVRPNSFFFPTELGARGLPTPEELAILEPYRGRIPDEVFTQAYEPPSTDGSGWPRANLKKAFALLEEAGWVVRDMKLVNAETGWQMNFEILLTQVLFERLVLPFKRNLERLGIAVRVRTVDQSQYINRVRTFDFDMVVFGLGQSLSPGNEQRNYWSSAAADMEGGYNYAGIKDPVVDELIELLIAAPDRESLIFRTRALDRVLLWGHYVIPQWDSPYTRILSWNKFGRPSEVPLQGVQILTWWYDEARARQLEQRGGQEGPPPDDDSAVDPDDEEE
ncbi:MAG TPA: extracellular solute-binding protein [Kiloniellales bacterium]|nr:extracellular solute-binding protein [Kiloniellales bacterium]